MKLWISGEIDSPIADVFRLRRNLVEEMINNILKISVYGNGLENWDVILIISENPGTESFKYSSKNRETDIKIQLDYKEFCNSDVREQKNLIVKTLIKSIFKITERYAIKDFDSLNLIRDLNKLIENAE